MDDATYDALVEELGHLDPRHPLVTGEAVGADPDKNTEKKAVPLPFPLGSLDKLKAGQNAQERREAERKLQRWVQDYPGPYTVSDKLDGVSALLLLPSRKLYSRGNGLVGHDISNILPHLATRIPVEAARPHSESKTRVAAYKQEKKTGRRRNNVGAQTRDDNGGGFDDVAIRGELVMSRAQFRNFLQVLHQEQQKQPAAAKATPGIDKNTTGTNARNIVSGAVNAKRPSLDVLRRTQFVPYAVLQPAGLTPQEEMRYLAKTLGFGEGGVVFHTQLPETALNVQDLTALLERRRHVSPFEVDGLVIESAARVTSPDRLNPLSAIAFKSRAEDNIAKTRVTGVEWSVTKDGLLKPVVEFQPVELSGVIVRRATGFNAEFVCTRRIGPGAEVMVTRSGDVIPHILEVVRPAGHPAMPRGQLRPGTYWKWTANGKDAILSSLVSQSHDVGYVNAASTDPDFEKRRLVHFLATLGVPNVSTGVVAKLYDAGFRTPKALMTATEADLSRVAGFGRKSIDHLHGALRKIRVDGVPCAVLMAASNAFGAGFGLRRLRSVVNAYPNVVTTKPSVEQLTRLDGISEKSAAAFLEGWEAFQRFRRHNDDVPPCYAVSPPSSSHRNKGTKKRPDLVVAFSGVRDAALERYIEEELGGRVTDTVNVKTKYVVVPDGNAPDTGKTKKAAALDVPVVPISHFLRVLEST